MEPTRTLYTTTTTVIVGGRDDDLIQNVQVDTRLPIQTFHVHTKLLTSNSAYFAAALDSTSGFEESIRNCVTLPGVDPRIFAFFVQWVYTKSLAHEEIDWEAPVDSESVQLTERDGYDSSRASSPEVGSKDKDQKALSSNTPDLSNLSLTPATDPKPKSKKQKCPPPAFFYLIRLYALADYLHCESLRNEIVDEVARVARARNSVPGPADTHELMEENLGGKSVGGRISGLRGLVIDLFVGKRTANLIATREGWNEEFLKQVVLKLKEREANLVPGVRMVQPYRDRKMRCLSYHEHRQTKKCVKWIGDV